MTSSLSSASLIISEYVEGSSFNKAIELFNTGSSSVDLLADGWTLELYSNGSASASATLNLSGTISAFATFIISHGSAAAAILNQANQTSSNVINFNGDDALVLKKAGTIVDSIGQVGFDPGTAWTSGPLTTLDRTLVRKPEITSGDTNVSDSYISSLSEWEFHPVDTFSNLGDHTFTGVVPEPTALLVWGGIGLLGVGLAAYKKKVA